MLNGMKIAISVAISFVSLCIAATACSSGQHKPDDAAAQAAREYYDSLRKGGYEYFTDMHFRKERIPESYHSQLIDNAKMFVSDLGNSHGGIKEVCIQNCKNDSTGTSAEAFLMLCFGDSTKEEIVVPMVKVNNKWMMR